MADEYHNIFQAYRLLRSFLQDRSATVRQMSVETLLPVLAHWALARGTLHSHLLDALLADLEAAVKNQVRFSRRGDRALATFKRCGRDDS